MEYIGIIKKRAAVFVLRHEKTPRCALIDQTADYFEREINGGTVRPGAWHDLARALDRALTLDSDPALALALDWALDLVLALARDYARTRPLPLPRALSGHLDLGLNLGLDLDLANYLLPLIDNRVPLIEHIDARIKRDIEDNGYCLDMSVWHACETTHCRAGFCELYAGEQGNYLVKHFGHWMCGALIYLKATGRIPDFYADDEEAWQDILKHATAA